MEKQDDQRKNSTGRRSTIGLPNGYVAQELERLLVKQDVMGARPIIPAMNREKILSLIRDAWYESDPVRMRRLLLMGHFFLTDDDRSKINMSIKELELRSKPPVDPIVGRAAQILNGKIIE